jgi:putative two-component system response regulator
MRKNSGSHFEPRLVELFENILPSILAIKETWAKKESHWKIPA